MTDPTRLTIQKPTWNEPYSVAAATWNHFLWVDLSALFDCPRGIDTAKTFLIGEDMIMLFIDPNKAAQECPYYPIIILKGLMDWWMDCQHKATKHCHRYNKWQKNKSSEYREEIEK